MQSRSPGVLRRSNPGDLEPTPTSVTGWFCPLHWTEVYVDHPILRSDLLEAGGFEHANIIRQPFADNPVNLTDDEWIIIERCGR